MKVYGLCKPTHTSAKVSHKGFHVQDWPDKTRKRFLILNLPVSLFRTPASLSPSAQGCPESCWTQMQHQVTISIDIRYLPTLEQLFFFLPCCLLFPTLSFVLWKRKLFFAEAVASPWACHSFSHYSQLMIKFGLWREVGQLTPVSLTVSDCVCVCLSVRVCSGRVSSAEWDSAARFVSITESHWQWVKSWAAEYKWYLLLVVRIPVVQVSRGLNVTHMKS